MMHRLLAALLLLALHPLVCAAAEEPTPARFTSDEVDPLLPRCPSIPETIDARALDVLLRESEAQKSDALLLAVGGCLLVNRRAPDAPELFETMSITKSVVSLAIGLLVEEKRIATLDAPLSTWFPEWKSGLKAGITLRHVLTHTSGLRHEAETRALDQQRNRLAYARALPVIASQVGKVSYNNEAAQLLSGIIEQAAGRPVDKYLAERLFSPLGITRVVWARDRAGHVSTYAGLRMRPADLLRLGLLLERSGAVDGKSLIPSSWITESTKPGRTGEGLLWWVRRGAGVALLENRLALLAQLGAPVDKLRPLLGRTFDSAAAGLLEAGAILDEAERRALASVEQRGVPVFTDGGGPPLGFFANGWLGQNLAVYSAPRLVAVRLKRQAGPYDEDENAEVGFAHFYAMLDAVARFAAPKLPDPSAPPDVLHHPLDEEVARGVRREGDTCELPRALIDKLVKDPTYLRQSVQSRLVGLAGEPQRLRLWTVRPGSIFERVGLSGGEVLVSVNDAPVATLDDVRRVYAAVRDEPAWRIVLLRRRGPATITCTLR